MEAAQVNVYLDAETHQRLTEHKDDEGRSMSQMAARLIKESMDRREAEAFDMGPTNEAIKVALNEQNILSPLTTGVAKLGK